mmetsp:Transcript_103418/g.293022  ORF Transcript_103418/g.293022 Transcript_103418/m.293022 type:complete len:400 (+) Transcript_103418:52-1251(+)
MQPAARAARGCAARGRQARHFALCFAVERREGLAKKQGREQFDLREDRFRGDFAKLHKRDEALRSRDPGHREAMKEVRRLGREGQWEEALSCLRGVPDADPFLRTATLDACARSWKLGHAQAIFAEMPIKTVAAYTTYIALLGRMRRIHEAVRLFETMQSERHMPDPASYTALMIGYGSVHDAKAAVRVLDDIVVAGFKLGQVEFGVALRACGKAGDHKLAAELLARMDEQQVTLNIGHLTSAIVSCARGKDSASAQAFFDQIRARGMTADNVAYTSLACCQEGAAALPKVESLLAEMRGALLSPDTFFYDEVLRIALADGRRELFHKYLAELDAAGLKRGSGTGVLVQQFEAAQAAPPGDGPLPAGWRAAADPASGQTYYWRAADPASTVTWERPRGD